MKKIKPSKYTTNRAKISWIQSKEDLRLAKTFINSSSQKSCLLSVQSTINGLSSILEANGHFQLPAFSCVELLDECLKYFKNLNDLRSHCYTLDSALERDVIGNRVDSNYKFNTPFARKCYESSKVLSEKINLFWKEYKFFT